MSAAYLMYKCRLCGQTFDAGHAPDGGLALLVARGLAPMPREWAGSRPGTVAEHECPDGSGIGLADLIGAVSDQYEPGPGGGY